MRKVLLAFAITWGLGLLGTARAQAPAPETPGAAPPPAAAPAAAAPMMITDADIKGLSGPKAEDKAKGDPGGTITGNVADIPVGDTKKGLTIGDVIGQVGQNMVAINFVWTLITGFLVMFMQAGFAAVETGSDPRQEREPHHDDELHGVRRRVAGVLADRLRDPGRRRRRAVQPGRHGAAQRRSRPAPVRQGLGPLRDEGHHADRDDL